MEFAEQPTGWNGEPKLAECYVISNGYDFIDMVCKEHAEEFAIENHLHWSNGHDFTDPVDSGATAYAVASWESNETDSPVSCGECHIYLECTMTRDGEAYMRENDFPAWLYDALGVSR